MTWGGRRAQALTALTLSVWGRTCHLCGRPGATTADHVIPRSKGGTDHLSNLRPAHLSCNAARGDMSLEEWRATRRYQDSNTTPSRHW